ncbi:MAG: hypothetical protein OER91_07660 [Gammaproteobacteria bacterium]|nr:hypothetical protein [Gammaproteobacteria bacterium]
MTAYSAEITPDPVLRRIVLRSGFLLGVAACLLILMLPAAWWVRGVLSIAWMATSWLEIRRLRRAWRACHRLRFSAAGDIEVLEADGQWYAASWIPGSVLLPGAGWIRLRNRHGASFGEFLRGDARRSADWRRLQVIWRHVGASG